MKIFVAIFSYDLLVREVPDTTPQIIGYLPTRTRSSWILLLKTPCTFVENQRGLKLELIQNLLSWVYFVMLRDSIGRPLEKKGDQSYPAVNPVC